MRSRSNSGLRLDYFRDQIQAVILTRQDPNSGLIRSSTDGFYYNLAWIRDNVYASLCVWGLSLAYRKSGSDESASAFQLEQIVVKIMRGLLQCFASQADKIERFKVSLNRADALHSVYDAATCSSCVADDDWGHLQLDALSLYLLTLAQMTTSGLEIIYTADEVALVQNLVFCVELSHRTPDFGVWERGEKSNQGVVELNASSVGMAKAALHALDGLDLYGSNGGGPDSLIHVAPDELARCGYALNAMLPRESNSKEVDAALLSVIGYPAFAVENSYLIKRTRDDILNKLEGRYGCARFLRDGYRTVLEDPNRLHYHYYELVKFENIESEWPLFWALLLLDAIFRGDGQDAEYYRSSLENILVVSISDDGALVMPELYIVPAESIDEERSRPHTVDRHAAGQIPHIWSQSLYYLAQMLLERLISPAELDPLNLRQPTIQSEVVVQVVVACECEEIARVMEDDGFLFPTIQQLDNQIRILPGNHLNEMFTSLGTSSEQLNLSGRPTKESIGMLATSQLYRIDNLLLAFTPEFWARKGKFYLAMDTELLMDRLKMELYYLSKNWMQLGRPTLLLVLDKTILAENKCSIHILSMLRKFRDGYTTGTRIQLGSINDFRSTSCITHLVHLENLSKERLNVLLLRDKDTSIPESQPVSPSTSISERILSQRGINVMQIIRHFTETSKRKRIQLFSSSQQDFTEYYKNLKAESSSSLGYEQNDLRSALSTFFFFSDVEQRVETVLFMHSQWGGDYFVPELEESVSKLLKQQYHYACLSKNWYHVRLLAGTMRLAQFDLSSCANDLLVRNKQLTVGLPPVPREKTILCPSSREDLTKLIYSSCENDAAFAVLTQEIIVYLSMLIKTSPTLFGHMIRIRAGLIIQVLVSEFSLTSGISLDSGIDKLLALNPFQVKDLLFHILSGTDFGVEMNSSRPSSNTTSFVDRPLSRKHSFIHNLVSSIDADLNEDGDFHFSDGEWLRRRRLDGCLNRVPVGFYPVVWDVLTRVGEGIAVDGSMLYSGWTHEMTRLELKFALQVEAVFNRVTSPEYRQLLVEVVMILGHVSHLWLGHVLRLDNLLTTANSLFLTDHSVNNGRAVSCCAKAPCIPVGELCGGANKICKWFYDSAPSGQHGTMSYLSRATAQHLETENPGCLINCSIS